MLSEPRTRLIGTPHGVRLEVLTTGDGDPVTVFAHGLATGIAQTRPLGSAVAGRKVFLQFRGHGRSDSPAGSWTYADFARDLRAIADLAGATRAVGASLGAGALVNLLGQSPGRFERVVFFLPAVLDQPRPDVTRARLEALMSAVRSGDRSALAAVLALELPAAVRDTPAGRSYLRQRVSQLIRDGLGDALSGLPDRVAIGNTAALAGVTGAALVIGCRGDELHPAPVAERLAAALPKADLHIYDHPGVLWTSRTDLRERISGFLNA